MGDEPRRACESRGPSAQSGGASVPFLLALAFIVCVVVGWSVLMRLHEPPPAPHRPLSSLLPGLRPRGRTPVPLPPSGYSDIGEAARALLPLGEPSGDLMRLRLAGGDHIYVGGHQVHPVGFGCARRDGTAVRYVDLGVWEISYPGRSARRLPPLPPSLRGPRCLLDSKDRLWASMGWGGGLWKFESGAWSREHPLEGLDESGGEVADIREDADGLVWLAIRPPISGRISTAALAVFDGASWKPFLPGGGLGEIAAGPILPLGHGTALVGSIDELVWVGKDVRYAFDRNDGLQAAPRALAYEPAAGRLLIAHVDGVTVADADGFRPRYTHSDGLPDYVEALGVDGEGRTWVVGSPLLVLPKGTL